MVEKDAFWQEIMYVCEYFNNYLDTDFGLLLTITDKSNISQQSNKITKITSMMFSCIRKLANSFTEGTGSILEGKGVF